MNKPNNHHAHANKTMTKITETEFMNNETRRLQELAGLIRLTGQSPEQIAEACHLDKRTVKRALAAQPLKSDATERIHYYIKKLLQQ